MTDGERRGRAKAQWRQGLSPTRLNLVANYISFAATALVGLIVNPMLVSALGASGFGAWKACQRIFDVAASSDGGSPQALKWTVAHMSATDAPDQKRRTVGAAIAVWALWLPVLVLISAVVVLTLPWLVNGLTPEEDAVLRDAATLFSANVVLGGLLSMPASVLIGVNKGYLAIGLATLSLLVANTSILVVARLGLGLIAVAAVVVGVSLLGALVTLVAARKSVDWWGVARPTRSDVVAFARFSGWVLLWSYVQRFLLSTEIVLISAFVGAAAVSQYTFTSYTTQFALSVCVLTTNAFMPRLAAAIGKGDHDAARTLTKETREINLAIVAILGAGMLAFNGAFVALWAGDPFYMGDTINVLIVIAFVQLALMRWNAQIQDTGLNVRGRALAGLAGTSISISLAVAGYALTDSLEWMLAAMIVGRLVLSVAFPLLSHRVAPFERSEIASIVRSYCNALFILAIGYCLHLVTTPTNLLTLLAGGLVAVALFAALAFIFVLSPATQAKIRSAVPRLGQGRR